jgi:hypothetical protein
VSYFIIEQEGSAPRVAEKTLEMRWDNASLRSGAIVGTVFGFYLGRRLVPGEFDGQLRVGKYRAPRWCRIPKDVIRH